MSGPIGDLALNSLVTIAEIVEDFEGFRREQVTIRGRVTEQLPSGDYLINDGTGSIPGDFSETVPPPLNVQLRILGQVRNGGAGFPAKIAVSHWDDLKKFNCDVLTEARLRFTDPGFKAGNIVGAYLLYTGVPAGEKVLERIWDEGNSRGDVEVFPVGQGEPQPDGTFRLEGVITHEYDRVKSTQKKKVRANLTLEGVDGRCSRVRDTTVSPGSGPESAAGGILRVTVDDPVGSATNFDVRATVKNRVSAPIEVQLRFRTPSSSTYDARKLPSGCKGESRDVIECTLGNTKPGEGLSKVVTYKAPTVSKDRTIKGSVVLVVGEFAPVASYATTGEALKAVPSLCSF